MPIDAAALDELIAWVGPALWTDRLAEIAARGAGGRSGRAAQQYHAIESTIERLRGRPNRPPSRAEQRIAALALALVQERDRLGAAGRDRLRTRLLEALSADGTLVSLFHLVGSAARHRANNFTVDFAGLEEEAPFDLLLSHDRCEAELVCDVVSAEAGRSVHRGAWFSLADRVDPDLQLWLADHPGRYLLKMTLPQGLDATDSATLGKLHEQIRTMLTDRRRADQSEAVVLRLDPLLLAAAQADELGLLPRLRREFGPEAHLSVTAAGEALFVMAARASQVDDVGAALHRRLACLAPTRFTGTRSGIIAMFIEDTDRSEWQSLRAQLMLERETRLFLTSPEARHVAAVSCTSRLEMFGYPSPDAAPGGRFGSATPPTRLPGSRRSLLQWNRASKFFV